MSTKGADSEIGSEVEALIGGPTEQHPIYDVVMIIKAFSYAVRGAAVACSGSLRRHFFTFASNAVSQHRSSAQALLILASSSTQVTGHVRLCCAKVVTFTRLCSGRPSRSSGNANKNPLSL